jgi:uncharacterized cupin superfamily protein
MAMTVNERAAETALEAAPIRPEWVVEGAPLARCRELSRSADGTAITAVWDCTAGAFNWHFAGDETVHILEGEVTVDDGWGPKTLTAGDVAFFPAGTWARWEVATYVKKLAFCRDPLPRPLLAFIGAVRKAKAMFGKSAAAPGGLAPQPA